VIVRSSVNLNAGAQTKLSAITHGSLLLICVTVFPQYLNLIPLSCLAAILLVTGIKLANPTLFRRMWADGRYQFIPFIVTLVAIVLTDLLVGILIGLAFSLAFILNSNLRRPIRRTVEKHLGEEVLHIELANQVSFLNRAALERVLESAPRGTHILLDARHSDYIDPDILALIREFRDVTAAAHGVQVSLRGFRTKYQLKDEIQFVDFSTRELQDTISPAQVLQILRDGNDRFRTGHRLTRDFDRLVNATSQSQHPLAIVLSCSDSRTPAELIFDVGLGDIFSVRIAGNVTSRKILGSIELGCAVAGAKLIVVMGHTRCGAVTEAVNWACLPDGSKHASPCQHLESVVQEMQHSIDPAACREMSRWSDEQRLAFIDHVARDNVIRTVRQIADQCRTIGDLIDHGFVAIVGAIYDVCSGDIEFLSDDAIGLADDELNAPAPSHF
jgi:carbonic anhydrase/SulP family sulfate permease